MKGIILAGGSGTRLYPSTKVVSKQLMPVYDKPMIYYPLSTLLLAGIREILIISTPQDSPLFQSLLGNGSDIGVEISYAIQPSPNGLAEAFLIGEKFINEEASCLILGDNIFFGHGFPEMVMSASHIKKGGVVFGYYVNDPERYGVVEFDKDKKVIGIEEKPKNPKSHYAIPGLYFYDNDACRLAKTLKPSERGELEITDLNKEYLKNGLLTIQPLGRGTAWLDTGTHDSLLEASNFIEVIEKRQGLKVGCIEEIAFKKNYITKEQLLKIAEPLKKSGYGQYLIRVANEN